MDWEDCVVDVHSIKLSKPVLETMFTKCGAVRSIIHWKGQGEKPHVFFEYKAPSSTDAARAVGLDRSDLQVIKISNNEMLKKKFRELAHGPIHDRDQRGRYARTSSRSTSSYYTRDFDNNAPGKDHRLLAKPITTPYPSEREARGRYETLPREGARMGDRTSRTSVPASTTSSSSNSRMNRRSPVEENPALTHGSGSTPSQPPSTSTRALLTTDVPNLRTRNRASNTDFRDRTGHEGSKDFRPVRTKGFPPTPPLDAPSDRKSKTDSRGISLAIIEIPHAGEVIKFDLDRQLETDPVGIIRILSAVKADQKLWMMTAAHYKGKHNLEAARKVLEAGIDMAAQVGEETDTKPFWHLLGQINGNLQGLMSLTASSVSSTTDSNPDVGSENTPQSIKSSPSTKENSCLTVAPVTMFVPSPPVDASFPSDSKPINKRNSTSPIPNKPFPHPNLSNALFPPQARPTGPRKRETHPLPPPPSPVPPSGPMGTPARLHNLQSEIDVLRDNQNAVLEDLSFACAAKRRAEDEVKEERSVRRKLEKHLRATEEALSRSKRMEDAALDQVKREVEARRRAEALLADMKARQEKAEASASASGVGHTFFSHPNVNDAAVLLQLASMIRGGPPSDRPFALQFGNGGIGPTAPPPGMGGAERPTATQSET